MTMSNAPTFQLPEGWSLRQVASKMVQEWLVPFRAEPTVRAARWIIQSIMELPPGDPDGPLWEPGISTSEYEERLNRPDLTWAVRATAGRGKGLILARFVGSKEHPELFQLVSGQSALPETLFDAGKVSEFLDSAGPVGEDGLFAAILTTQGFETVTP